MLTRQNGEKLDLHDMVDTQRESSKIRQHLFTQNTDKVGAEMLLLAFCYWKTLARLNPIRRRPADGHQMIEDL